MVYTQVATNHAHKPDTHTRVNARARVGVWTDSVTACGKPMRCNYPRLVNGVTVACGKCKECHNTRVREWTLRLMHELQTAKKAVFVTLTYDDDHIPGDGMIAKDEFQRFMKRLRKRTRAKHRYYAAGEYGGLGRPHYHAIIYGLTWCMECRCCSKSGRKRNIAPLPGTDCWHIEKAWDMGYTHIGDVTPASCRYVADYLQKSDGEHDFGGRTKPFNLMSKGLGKAWMHEHQENLYAQGGIMRYGKPAGMPRYYHKKVVEQFGDMQNQAAWILRCQRTKSAMEAEYRTNQELKKKYGTWWDDEKRKRRLQNELNLTHRAKRKKDTL